MIQALQKFSQSRIAKVFLAIVALSFMAFFGGGNWFRPHDPNAVVAEIGDLSISRYEFEEKVQQESQNLMAHSGQSMTREDLLKAGVPQMVLSQLTQEILLNLEAESLGISVSDETIRNQVQSLKAFQNKEGKFDRAIFAQVLRANNRSEDAFIAEVRLGLIRDQLIDAIAVGAYLPDEMVDRLFEAQFQYRQASLLIVSPKEMAMPPAPEQKVLEAFYNDHEKEFRLPELRTFTAFVIDVPKLAKDIPVTEEEVKAVYEAKAESFGKKPLKDVKPLIIAEVQKEKALEKAYQLSQQLDDKIAGGATYEELAPTLPEGQLMKLEALDTKGHDKMQELSAQLPKDKELAKEILQTAFGLEEGADSPFTQGQSGYYYAIRLDKINPAALQPFAEIKDRVLKVWQENEQLRAAYEKAEKYVKSFNEGDLKISLMKPLSKLSLSEPSPSVSDDIKQVVFSLRPGQAGLTYTKGDFAVVVLNKITPPLPKVKEEKMASFKERLLSYYKNDLLTSYLNALRVRYPVKINNKAIKALFSAQE